MVKRAYNQTFLLPCKSKRYFTQWIRRKRRRKSTRPCLHEKGDATISAEFFVKACDVLNVSMDLIASTDLSSMPEQETFTYDFLKRLASESSNKDWKQLLGEWEQKYNSEHDAFETNIPFEQLPEVFFCKAWRYSRRSSLRGYPFQYALQQ